MLIYRLKNDIYLQKSLLLHLIVICLLGISVNFHVTNKLPPSPPIVVDLKNVEIAPKTNLPTVPEENKEEAPKPAYSPPKEKRVEVLKVTKKIKVTETKKETQKKEIKTIDKATKKDLPKTPVKKEEIHKKEGDDLSSLLASVEKMKDAVPVPRQRTISEVAEEMAANKGIRGGIGGDYKLALTISEQDAIGSKLRECWNLDAGAKGVLDMVIEVKAFLSPSGNVTDVKIMDMSRYNSDPAFRAIADSARRAVYVCDRKHEGSPFRILPEKYSEHFDKWQEIYLKFNPLDGGVI